MNDPSSLSDEDLLALLRTEGDRLPRAVVDEFVARGGRMVKPLTRILDSETNWDEEGDAYWRPVHAAFILGAIGGDKAMPGLLAALRFSEAFYVDEVGDALPVIFASIGRPAVEPLIRVSREEEPGSALRHCAHISLAETALHQPDLRDSILDSLRAVAASPDESNDDRVSAAAQLLDFARPGDRDLLLEIAAISEAQTFDLFSRETVEKCYQKGFQAPTEPPQWLNFYSPEEAERRRAEPTEVEPELDYDPDPDPDADLDDVMDDLMPPPRDGAAPLPRAAAVQRNDPCPCGSGKKFKKCCER